jgi:hypothetical protein
LHEIVFGGNLLQKSVEQQYNETNTPFTIVVGVEGHVAKI